MQTSMRIQIPWRRHSGSRERKYPVICPCGVSHASFVLHAYAACQPTQSVAGCMLLELKLVQALRRHACSHAHVPGLVVLSA